MMILRVRVPQYILISGLTDEYSRPSPDLRAHVGAGRQHALPAAPGAGAAGADRGRDVRGAAAPAEHREPAPEDAGGRGVAGVAGGGDQPPLPDGGRPAGALGAAAVDAGARAG